MIQKNGGSFAIQLAQSAQVDELSRIFGKWEGTERFLKEYGVSLQGFGYYTLIKSYGLVESGASTASGRHRHRPVLHRWFCLPDVAG